MFCVMKWGSVYTFCGGTVGTGDYKSERDWWWFANILVSRYIWVMNDKEKFAILKFIQMWERSMGLHRADILSHMMSMMIPLDSANACLETLITDDLIEQSRMTSLFILTPKATLWIRDNDPSNINRLEYLKFAHKVANTNISKEKPSGKINWTKWGTILTAIGIIVAIWLAKCSSLEKTPNTENIKTITGNKDISADKYLFTGFVIDSKNGQSISDANVTFKIVNNGREYKTKTDSAGYFLLEPKLDGNYNIDLTAVAANYKQGKGIIQYNAVNRMFLCKILLEKNNK